VRHRTLEKVIQALMAELTHPLRFTLELGNLLDDLMREPLAGLEHVVLGLAKTPLILFQVETDIRLRAHDVPPYSGPSSGPREKLPSPCMPPWWGTPTNPD